MMDSSTGTPNRSAVGVMVALSAIQVVGVAADVAGLVSLSRETVFIVAGTVAAILSAILVTVAGSTASTFRMMVAALTFAVSGSTVGIGVISRFDPPEPPARGEARIVSPPDGQALTRCQLAVSIEGSPAAGKALVAVTKQLNAAYYFEPQVEPTGSGRWTASVQLGQRKPTENENYEISVVEIDKQWVGYLAGVLRSAGEEDATYWNTPNLPPGTTEVLHRINVHRTPTVDPTCPE